MVGPPVPVQWQGADEVRSAQTHLAGELHPMLQRRVKKPPRCLPIYLGRQFLHTPKSGHQFDPDHVTLLHVHTECVELSWILQRYVPCTLSSIGQGGGSLNLELPLFLTSPEACGCSDWTVLIQARLFS